jgi:hypothetical protein
MPKIDIPAVPKRKGSGYPLPFDAPCRFVHKDGTPYPEL